MNVEHVGDAGQFLRVATPLLLEDEARHNLMLGVAAMARDRPEVYPEFHSWVARDAGEVVGLATQTPPFHVAVARPRDHRALVALAAAIDDAPGVVAATPEADEFAERWCQSHGANPRMQLGQGVYALERVQRPPPAAGARRKATEHDRELLVDWLRAFAREALSHESPNETRVEQMVDHRLRADDGGFFVWEDCGEIVSLAGAGGRTPNGVRIGPVYTPPALRGRGYATSLVADVSQWLLDGGPRFCFLYTDLANPTSNAIYERIGYVRICESKQIAFER